MRHFPQILCLLGLVAAAFGYWGVNTVAGRRRFDEMAGMIPLGIGALGVIFLLAGLIWIAVRLRA